jgi:hypothetical protein
MSSGARSRTASQLVAKDASPARPRISLPPAWATISGTPMPGGKGGIEPLGDEDAPGLEPGHQLAHPADLLLHPGHHLRAAVGHAEPPGELEHALLDLRDRPRVERDPSQLDPAYVDAQLSYLEQALGSLRSRSEALGGAASALAAARQTLIKTTAALQRWPQRRSRGTRRPGRVSGVRLRLLPDPQPLADLCDEAGH